MDLLTEIFWSTILKEVGISIAINALFFDIIGRIVNKNKKMNYIIDIIDDDQSENITHPYIYNESTIIIKNVIYWS